MRGISRIAFGLSVCVLIISALAVMAPRAVHAVVATLVRDADNAGRHPFTSFCSFALPPSSGISSVCSINVPSGEEIVIETVSVSSNADPTNKALLVQLESSVSGKQNLYAFSVADSGLQQPNTARFDDIRSARFYADPLTNINCFGTIQGNQTGMFFACAVSGYSVSLP